MNDLTLLFQINICKEVRSVVVKKEMKEVVKKRRSFFATKINILTIELMK
jgi:hypothetical protein